MNLTVNWLKARHLSLLITLCSCILVLFAYLYYYSGDALLLIYIYFALLAILVLQVFTIRQISPKTQILLVLITLFLVTMPLFGLNIAHNVVMTSSDQSYDLSMAREIVQTGRLQTSNVALNARSTPYSYFPAIHIFAAFLVLTTALPETVIMAIPTLVNIFFFFVLFSILAKSNIRLAGLLVLLSITFGYGYWQIQFVRETYSSVLQTLLILLLLLSLTQKTHVFNPRSTMVVTSLILVTISFSHFYLQFTFLALLLFIFVLWRTFRNADFGIEIRSNSHFLNLQSQKMVKAIFLLGLLIFLAYDALVAWGYIADEKFSNIFSNVVSFFSTVLHPETISNLSTLGSQLSIYERSLIYLQQVALIICVPLLVIFIIRGSKLSKRALIPLLIGLPLYSGFLALRLSQNFFVNLLGLRASGVIFYFFVLYLIFLSNYVKRDVLEKIFKVTLIFAVISILCFPALIPPGYKDHTLSYEVPAQVARTISPFYPTSLSSYVIEGESVVYQPPDSFSAFDSYLQMPRFTYAFPNISYAQQGSIVYVDKQFFNQFDNFSVVVNIHGQTLGCDVIFSAPGLYLVYVPPING